MVSLQGKIEHIFLSSVLQLLCNDKKSGLLRVWRSEDEVRIYLHEGTIIYATSSEKKHRLGFILRSTGLVTPENLQKCRQLAKDRQQTLGKTLVEQNFISEENLKDCMTQKAQQTLYGLFIWEKGFFEFQDKQLDLKGHILIELNTMELILEASRQADEKAALEKKRAGKQRALELEKQFLEKTTNFMP